MKKYKSWQHFLLNEGGIKSAKTDAKLTPEIVIRAIDVYNRVIADFNSWLSGMGEMPVRSVKPVGSVSYAQRDLQDKENVIYGDVDYLVEFPLPASPEESYTEAAQIHLWLFWRHIPAFWFKWIQLLRFLITLIGCQFDIRPRGV